VSRAQSGWPEAASAAEAGAQALAVLAVFAV
jgi:hypothetical protein